MQRAAIVLFASLPLVSFPPATDPFQPVRGVILGVAVIVAVLAFGGVGLPERRFGRVALIAVSMVGAGLVLSAVVNGLPSAVFGAHARFQGLVSAGAAAAALVFGLTIQRKVRFLADVLAAAVVVQALIIAWQRVSGAEPTGVMGNPVLVASWLAIGTAVVAAAARSTRGFAAWTRWAAVAAGVLALGLAGSRGGWVGLVAGLVPVLVSLRSRTRLYVGFAVVVTLLSGVLVGGGEGLQKLDPRSLTSGSAASRAEIWRGTAAMIVQSPLLGSGPGRFLYVFPRFEPVERAIIESGDVRVDQAHGVVLQTAAEAGVPVALAGLALFGVAIVACARRARAGDAAALAVLAGLAAYCGQAVFGIGTIEVDSLAFALVGVALARTGEGQPRRGAAFAAGLTLAALVIVSCGYFLRADVTNLRGVRAFYAGDMDSAYRLAERTVAQNPLVDVYRVALSDAASYGGPTRRPAALASLDEGLRLEPDSYDLVLARARLLVLEGAAPGEVSDEYELAAALYPRGIVVRREAMEAAMRAERPDVARRLAEDVLAILPEDPQAIGILERVGVGGH